MNRSRIMKWEENKAKQKFVIFRKTFLIWFPKLRIVNFRKNLSRGVFNKRPWAAFFSEIGPADQRSHGSDNMIQWIPITGSTGTFHINSSVICCRIRHIAIGFTQSISMDPLHFRWILLLNDRFWVDLMDTQSNTSINWIQWLI